MTLRAGFPALFLAMLVYVLAGFVSPILAAEKGAPPDRPEVPEPLVPELTDVPPGMEPGEWKSWAVAQEVTSLRRFQIEAFLGYSDILIDAMAGNGTDAPSYSTILAGGPRFGLEARFALLPVLSVGAGFSFYHYEGRHWYPESQPSLDYYFGPYGNNFEINHVTLVLKARVPLLVWTLSRHHLRFSNAEEITGFVFFVKLEAGPAMITEYELCIRDRNTGDEIEWKTYYESTTNFALNYGFGVEYRWSWGGFCAEFDVHNLGTPESGWSPNSDSEALVTMGFRGSFGLFF
jgi:hypothetical protein